MHMDCKIRYSWVLFAWTRSTDPLFAFSVKRTGTKVSDTKHLLGSALASLSVCSNLMLSCPVQFQSWKEIDFTTERVYHQDVVKLAR